MKLLLVILGAVIAINGISAESSEVDAKKIGEEVLKQIKSLHEEVLQIRDDVKHSISLKLKQIPEVKKVEEQYIEGLTQKSIDVECAVSVDKQYLETLETITNVVLKNSLKNVTDDDDYLNTVQKKLNVVLVGLEKNDISSVDFIDISEELFKFVDLVKPKLLNHAENEVSSEEVQEIVKTYIANVPKCLTEKQ